MVRFVLSWLLLSFLSTQVFAIDDAELKKSLWFVQLAKSHAKKICTGSSEGRRMVCEAENIRSILETVAGLQSFRPKRMSQFEYFELLDGVAKNDFLNPSSPAALDCRVSVC